MHIYNNLLINKAVLSKLLAIFLYPLSFLYGLATYLRNKCFDLDIFKSIEFRLPIISVGNLSVGGVGKTPHVEYLIRLLLREQFKTATLSRGYGRLTSGYYISDNNSTIFEIGDEPMQFKRKFQEITVAVDEKRVRGIRNIIKESPVTQVIILDDAYQHRAVKPGINILVTDYSKLYIDDHVLPSGRLREWAMGSDRADIIIVSKTPSILSPIDLRRIKEELNPKPYQEIYFSYTKYSELIPFTKAAIEFSENISSSNSVLLITGIAKPLPLYYYLKDKYTHIEHLKFPDHHYFTSKDIETIKNTFISLYGNNKLLITTEKDIMRLSLQEIKENIEDIPLFYLPIEICFHGNGGEEFDSKIIKYVKSNTRN